jgi:hypothetical protein
MSDPYRTAPPPEPPDPYVEFADAIRVWMQAGEVLGQATARLLEAWRHLPPRVTEALRRLFQGGSP